MISVVIRNKNEAGYLKRTLSVLNRFYKNDIDEIILVDNLSTDDSIAVAEAFGCKIVTIDKFSYGKAINLGIETARNEWILLLSSHAIPIGNSFFSNTKKFITENPNVAGLRYINSATNYERALDNDFRITDPISYGLMAACCVVSKKVWQQYKFNESLGFSEDKHWSGIVSAAGYPIVDFNETFFYDIKRTEKGLRNRYKNETIAHYQLHRELKYPNTAQLFMHLLYKLVVLNTKGYFKLLRNDLALFKIKLQIRKSIDRTHE